MAIVKGLKIPNIQRTVSTRASKYEFADLEVNDSFFVKADAKTFASRVAFENKRYSEPTGNVLPWGDNGRTREERVQVRLFKLVPVTKGLVYEEGFVEDEDGVRVFRVL